MTVIDTITESIKRRYNRTALFYDWMDFMIRDSTRKEVIGMAWGKVLEVGVGTGSNLPFYPSGCEVTGIDFSSEMLKRARKKSRKAKYLSQFTRNGCPEHGVF